MGWFTGAILYILIWWVVLFAVLPFGTKPVVRADQQTGWRGAPENPHLLRKAIATTIVSAIVWMAAYYLVIANPSLSFRHGILAARGWE
jgi:predicted secreted protein